MTHRWRKMTREVSWSVDPSVVASLLSLTFAERSPLMTPIVAPAPSHRTRAPSKGYLADLKQPVCRPMRTHPLHPRLTCS